MQSDESSRLNDTYADYARSARKQRAWASDNPGNVAIRRELIASVLEHVGDVLDRGAAVLDIGCGSGWWLSHLAADDRVTAQLVGIELLPVRASLASARVPGASISVGDARSLELENEAFDLVTLFTVLSSMSTQADVAQALAEAARVVAPRGALVIWEPRMPNPRNPRTALIPSRLIGSVLEGTFAVHSTTLTLIPALARSLGAGADRLYPMLAGVPALRSHRLYWARRR